MIVFLIKLKVGFKDVRTFETSFHINLNYEDRFHFYGYDSAHNVLTVCTIKIKKLKIFKTTSLNCFTLYFLIYSTNFHGKSVVPAKLRLIIFNTF